MNDWERMVGGVMPLCSGTGATIIAPAPDGGTHIFDGLSGALIETRPFQPPGPNEYHDCDGWICSRTICDCGHDIAAHSTGACDSGDDDGDGYFDECWCRRFKSKRLRYTGITT